LVLVFDRQKSEDDRGALEKIGNSIEKVGNHFEVGLPYINFETMPNNQQPAIYRLMYTGKKLVKIKIEPTYNSRLHRQGIRINSP
jgi:hypothetical protein